MICPECNGRGESIYYVETHRDENSVTVEQRKGICRTCNGSGEKQQINADRIRAMSDEELAAFINKVVVNHHIMKADKCDHCPLKKARPCDTEGIIDWLKQTAEE